MGWRREHPRHDRCLDLLQGGRNGPPRPARPGRYGERRWRVLALHDDHHQEDRLGPAVHVRIRSLEILGEVLVIHGAGTSSSKGGLRSNRYRVTVHIEDEPDTDASVLVESDAIGTPASVSETDDTDASVLQTLTPASPLIRTPASVESSVESPVEPSKRHGSFDDDFEAVWTAYPRKLEKAKALKAYTARRKAGASREDLLAATKHYAGSVRSTVPKYVKLGATFYGPNRPFSDWIAGPPEGKPGGAGAGAIAPDWERAVNPTPSW